MGTREILVRTEGGNMAIVCVCVCFIHTKHECLPELIHSKLHSERYVENLLVTMQRSSVNIPYIVCEYD